MNQSNLRVTPAMEAGIAGDVWSLRRNRGFAGLIFWEVVAQVRGVKPH